MLPGIRNLPLKGSCIVLAAVQSSVAFQFITEATLPSDSLSDGCAAALVANVDCPRQVSAFVNGAYFESETLDATCTTGCSRALGQYESDVSSACGEDDVYQIAESRTAPVSFIPTMLYYYYNRTCIQDDGRWCNNVVYDMSGNGTAVALTKRQETAMDMCDDCVIKEFQFQAGSPINGGYGLQSNYSSLTSSCSKTEFPLATSSDPFSQPATTTTDAPTPSCTGTTYTIQPGDTCRSISQSQGIGTALLLQDNGLTAYCVDFPTEGKLCIQSTCDTYTVGNEDTCQSISLSKGISQVQLYTWNPILGTNCRNINRSVSDLICITPPGDNDFTTDIPTVTATPEPTSVPVPTDVADGTNHNCALYYLVQPGDYCNLVILKFAISLDDFLFLNPAVNTNCTNLFAYESYCVAAVGPIDQYPGHPDYIPPASSISTIPYSDLSKATFTAPPVTNLPTLLPLATGTRKDCFVYANGDDLAIDIAGTFYTSQCAAIVQGWTITLQQLQNWNPSLDTTSSDCAPDAEYRYCMGAYDGALVTQTAEPTETGSALPIREGATEDCKAYAPVTAPMTCQSVLDFYGITIAQFYEWNPAVGSQCGNLWLGYRYCVRVDDYNTESSSVPSTTTSTTSATTTTTGGPPGPTQSGVAPNCNAWHLVVSGDSCWALTQEYGITLAQFYEWNPAVTNDCADGFWLDTAYCVGVSS